MFSQLAVLCAVYIAELNGMAASIHGPSPPTRPAANMVDTLCGCCRVSMTIARSNDEVELLDERCRPALVAANRGHLETCVALLNEAHIPAYASIEVWREQWHDGVNMLDTLTCG